MIRAPRAGTVARLAKLGGRVERLAAKLLNKDSRYTRGTGLWRVNVSNMVSNVLICVPAAARAGASSKLSAPGLCRDSSVVRRACVLMIRVPLSFL